MTSWGTWSTPTEVEEQAVGGAADFVALTRLARVLLATGVLCLCAAGLALATSPEPFSERASLITSVGVLLCAAGLTGTAVRWPPGAAGRRSLAVLVVAVVLGLAGLVAAATQLPSGPSAAFVLGYPAVSGLLGQLLFAGLLRSLLWRSTGRHPQGRPALPRRAWWPCVGLGLVSLLLPAVTWLLTGPTEGPASTRAVATAAAQTVRQVADVGLGSALLAAVLLCWLLGRVPGVQPAAPSEGEPMEDGTTPQSWDAVSPPHSPAPDGLAGRLVALGLGAVALSAVLWGVLYGVGDLGAASGLLSAALFVVSGIVSVAGSAALTAGLVGLVLERALPMPAPVPALPQPPAEPSGQEADAVEPPPGADPDARWRR